MSYYNTSQYYQSSIEAIGSKDDFYLSEAVVTYDNTIGLYPVCDVLVEFINGSYSGPDKKITLHKFCYTGSFDINKYKNVLTNNKYQGTFIDCNAANEKFPLDSSYNLYDGVSQYYVFTKIFLPPCNIGFFFTFDSGLDFNTYLIPYTLGI